MPEEALVATLTQVEVYQFQVWIRQISLAIWHRFLIMEPGIWLSASFGAKI